MKRKLLLILTALILSMGGAFAASHSGKHYGKEMAETSGYGKVYAELTHSPEEHIYKFHGSSTPYWSGTNPGATTVLTVNCDNNGSNHSTFSYVVTFTAEPLYGCRFLGWKRNKTDASYFSTKLSFRTGERLMHDNCSSSPSNAPIISHYYAYFAPNHYTILFDKNSEEATGTQPSINATCNVDYTLAVNACTRPGYCLKSWNTQADGSGTDYYRNSVHKNLTIEDQATVTLYAQWVQNVDPVYEQKVFSFHANEVYENVFTSTNTLNDFTLTIKNASPADVATILPGNKLQINREGRFDLYVDQPEKDEYNPVVDKKLASCVTSTYDFLSMKAVGGDVTIGINPVDDDDFPLTYVLQYSPDRATWTDYAVKNATENLVTIPEGQTYYFRNASPVVRTSVMEYKKEGNSFNKATWNFTMSGAGTIEAGGNIMSLLDQTCQSLTVGEHCFEFLFEDCTLLTTAPKLPATTLAECCYYSMFYGCTQLQKAPYLPATTVYSGSYSWMFGECTSLTYVEADLTNAIAGSGPQDIYYKFKNATEKWLPTSGTNGALVLARGMAEYQNAYTDEIDIPDNWKPSISVQMEEANPNSGVFYATCGHMEGGRKVFDVTPINGIKAMYVQVADGKVFLSNSPDNACHGEEAMVLYGHSNRAIVMYNPATKLKSDDNILGFGETTVPANGYILKHGASGFGFYKSTGETISKYDGYFVYADGPDFMPMYNLSYLAPMWDELDNHVAEVLGSELSDQVTTFVQTIKTNMDAAPNEDAARAILDAGIADFDQHVANHQHSYTHCVDVDAYCHHIFCTNADGFCNDIDHGIADHVYGDDVEQTSFYTCQLCGHIDEVRRRSYGTRNSLSLTAVGGDVTIGLNRVGLPNDQYQLMVSSDRQIWNLITLEATNSMEIKEGETLYFCYGGDRVYASNNNTHENALNYDDNNGWRFSVTGEGTVEAGGNIISLLDKTAALTTVGTHAFSHLFEGCSKLTMMTFPKLTTVGSDAFKNWLNGTAAGTEGKLVASLDNIGNSAACLPVNWQWATQLKLNEDPTDGEEGNFYTTFFDSRYDYIVEDGFNAYSGIITNTEDDERELRLTATPNKIIPKGDGVIIHGGSGEVLLTISEGSAQNISGNVLTGSDTDISASADCYILSYGQNGLGFYRYEDEKTLSAHKAYLIYEPHAAQALRMVFDDGTVTGIDNVNVNVNVNDNDGSLQPCSGQAGSPTGIYSVSGIRLNQLQKGINIVNGKKVLVK